jgi:hypothetical protein
MSRRCMRAFACGIPDSEVCFGLTALLINLASKQIYFRRAVSDLCVSLSRRHHQMLPHRSAALQPNFTVQYLQVLDTVLVEDLSN